MARCCPVCGTDHNNHICNCDIEADYAALKQSHDELLESVKRCMTTDTAIQSIVANYKLEEAIAKAEALQAQNQPKNAAG